VIKIWANLIRFGQSQNLASPKSFNPLRLCIKWCNKYSARVYAK